MAGVIMDFIKWLHGVLGDYLRRETKSTPPEWLNQEQNSYIPKIQIIENKKTVSVSIEDPRDIYTKSTALEDFIKGMSYDKLQHDEKLMAIWQYVIDDYRYIYDSGDAWQYPTTTWHRGGGDCEDTTILFVVLCRVAGIPANKVFNAIGLHRTSGHSYPIAQMSDGKWYIFESTLSKVPAGPKLFKNSNYTADYGVANDIYSGVIRDAKQV